VGQAHELSHLLEQEIRRQIPEVVEVFVHLEPGEV
jgi:divalent metal cation (Fe/Co/Zn/Cd) transporter